MREMIFVGIIGVAVLIVAKTSRLIVKTKRKAEKNLWDRFFGH